VELIRKNISKEFGLSSEEFDRRVTNFRSCMRPTTADEMLLIGPMTKHPNVFLNTGHGQWGVFSIPGGKLLESQVFNTGEADKMFEPVVVEGVKP
jgi:glycine/D-amino acid oxidase-like deaminating enzyme